MDAGTALLIGLLLLAGFLFWRGFTKGRRAPERQRDNSSDAATGLYLGHTVGARGDDACATDSDAGGCGGDGGGDGGGGD